MFDGAGPGAGGSGVDTTTSPSRNKGYRDLGNEVRAHQRAVDALDEAAAACLGINRTDLRCLDVLLETEAAASGQLAGVLGLTTGSVTAMLDRLEKLGYLARTDDSSDRRRVVVKPTRKATLAAEELSQAGEEGGRGHPGRAGKGDPEDFEAIELFAKEQLRRQYRGTLRSISRLQRSMPPSMLRQSRMPFLRNQLTTFRLRIP